MTPEQFADRESVWKRIAAERPEFTQSMDLTNNYHTVREIVLGGSLTWAECNRRFMPFVGARVMDIGANVGIYSAWCAARGARVTAYEPHPEAFALLCKVIGNVGLKIEPVNKAISDFDGVTTFAAHVNPDPMCTWYNGGINKDGEHGAFCISFEEAIGETDWECVKMDVEGEEFNILRNTPDEALRRIKFLYVEFHPWASQELYDRTIQKLSDVFHFTGFFQNSIGRWEVGYCHKR